MFKRFLCLCIFFGIVLPAYGQQFSPGLIFWLKAVPGFTGGPYWYDVLGRYNGTLTNFTAPSVTSGWNAGTRQGSAGEVRFNGTTNFINIPNSNALLVNAPAYTYTAWLKQTATNVKAGIFMKKVDVNNFISIETYNDNKLYADMVYAGSSASGGIAYTSIVTAGTWFHLAVVFNGAGTGNAGKSVMYINGKPQTVTFAGTFPTVSPNTAGAPIWLGKYDNVADLVYWNGAMDDVRLYNRALTATDVRAVMNDAPPLEQFSVADVTIPSIPTPGGVPNTSVTIPGNLVAQWKGLPDFSSGKFWYNVVAPQHGTLTNGAVFQASGRQGGVQHLSCDGVNDYVNITPPPLSGGKYTVMFWAKDDFSGTFGFNLDMTYTAGRFALSLNGGNWTGVARGISIFVSGPTYDLSATNALPLSTWSHIAVTLNAATNISTGYINGNPTGTGGYTDTFGGVGTLFRFCTRDDLSGSYSKGLYDDLRIYDAELTAADIRTLYQQSIQDTNIITAAFLPSIAAPQGKGFFNFFGQ